MHAECIRRDKYEHKTYPALHSSFLFFSRRVDWSASGVFVLKAAEEYYGQDEDTGGQQTEQHLAALQLDSGASEADIRKAYRTLSMRWYVCPRHESIVGLSCLRLLPLFLLSRRAAFVQDGNDKCTERGGVGSSMARVGKRHVRNREVCIPIRFSVVVDFSVGTSRVRFRPRRKTRDRWRSHASCCLGHFVSFLHRERDTHPGIDVFLHWIRQAWSLTPP